MNLVRLTMTACAVLVLGALPTHAQVLLTGLERELELKVSPEYPTPGQEVILSLSGFAVDLDRSAITWYANGKRFAGGDGLTETRFTVGLLGSLTRIQVIAENAGIVGSAQATIRPTEVDVIWNADSYVPPFYRGRIFPGTGSTIHAQALVRFKKADGMFVSDNNIIYSWYKNSTRIAGGRGKSHISFSGPSLLGEDMITVEAESMDGTYRGRGVARIRGVDPSVELYENHPLFGTLYHRALSGNVTTLEKDQTLTAVPYFASVTTPDDSSLSYEWKIGGTIIPAIAKHPSVFTITANGYTGPVSIELLITSARDWFLRASGTWELVFSETSSSLLPGNPFGN